MDEINEANGCETKPALASLDEDEEEEDAINGEDESESKCLLPPTKETPKTKEKTKMKVKWNDTNGNKLAEVLEYEPSEASDGEDDDTDACICTVM